MAQETMGPSIVINPSENTVVAPFAGKILFVFPTKHAIGLKREDGLEVLLHIGIDTVELNGKHFKSFVKENQTVKQNQKLIEVDIQKVKEAGYDPSIVCIFTSLNGQTINKPENKAVSACESLIEI
jgi:glucose-specific phosphotransferase system IIA component